MMTREQIIERFKNNDLAENMGLATPNPIVLHACLDQWEQPHRYYHGLNHLSDLLNQIDRLPITSSQVWNKYEKEKMEILALFHDVIYDPRKKDNEDASIQFIKNFALIDFRHEAVKQIIQGIHYTKYTQSFLELDDDDFVKEFCQMDIGSGCGEYEGHPVPDAMPITLTDLTKREMYLLKEFQFVSFPTYREKRIEFVKNFQYYSDIHQYTTTDFLSSYRPKIGVYPGSFNPFSVGHMNILEQAEKIFDKVIIAIGKNPDKVPDRTGIYTVEKILPFHEVAYYDGLLSDYLKTLDYADITVIRGLRSGYDLDYEMTQLRILEDYGCKLPVTYFLCSKETTHVSSSMIRGLSKFSNGHPEKYIPTKYDYAKKY